LPLYSLYLLAFVNYLGVMTLMTLLPTYIELLNPSGIVIGLFVTGVTLAQGIAIVPYSWAGDRFNKRRILIVGLIVCSIAYSLFIFVNSSGSFIGVRFVQGLGYVGVSLLALAFVSELAPVSERANTIGKYNAWRLAGGLVGAVGAGVLYDLYGFEIIYAMLVAMFAIAIGSTLRFTTADPSSVGFSFGELALNRQILTLISFRSQYAFAVTLTRNWVPIFAGVSAAEGGLGFAAVVVGIIIATEQATNMVCQPVTGKLSDRYGRAQFVFVGGGLYGLFSISIPFVYYIDISFSSSINYPFVGELSVALLLLVILNGILGVVDSLREPASMGLFADVGNKQGGVASSFGIRNLVWQPGNIIAPLIGGVVMTQFGIEWVFYLAGAFAISGSLSFIYILYHNNGLRALFKW